MKDSSASVLDYLVVTSPTAAISEVYRTLLSQLKYGDPIFSKLKIKCVSDPAGVRVGSGGGTLNALDSLRLEIGEDKLLASNVAIVHSGGDSRRAPLHSINGKAWSSINGSPSGATPIALLVKELSGLCSYLHARGALVVASSDVLLDICFGDQVPLIPENAVSVVTVPESPDIAKNHGVLVKSANLFSNPSTAASLAKKYLQKPSVAEMIAAGAVESSADGSPLVQIDTGIVIFTGSAFQRLTGLLDEPIISKCTARGLGYPPTVDASQALRLELYSDILHCMALHTGPCLDILLYYKRLGIKGEATGDPSLYRESLVVLFEALKSCPLFLIAASAGTFCHLGTSAELLDLLSSCALTEDSSSITEVKRLSTFRKKYNLCSNVASTIISPATNDPKVVLINSILAPTPGSDAKCTGPSLVEHSQLSGHFLVGKRAVVSHVGAGVGVDLKVNDAIMLQQVPLRAHCKSGRHRCVLLTLGIDDDVKALYTSPKATVCGAPWSAFFKVAGVTADFIWPDAVDDERTLWTAKVFPSFTAAPANSIVSWFELTWFQQLGRSSGNAYDESVSMAANRWRAFPPYDSAASDTLEGAEARYSLSDLLGAGSAQAMYAWKTFMHVHQLQLSTHAPAIYGDRYHNIESSPSVFCTCFSVLTQVSELLKSVGRSVSSPVSSVASGSHEYDYDSTSLSATLLLCVWCFKLCDGGESESLDLLVVLLTQLRLPLALHNIDTALLTTLNKLVVHLWHAHNADSQQRNVESGEILVCYLKDLSLPANLLAVAQVLTAHGAKSVKIEAQPRLLLLVAWLVADRYTADNAGPMPPALSAVEATQALLTTAKLVAVANSPYHSRDVAIVVEAISQRLIAEHIQKSFQSYLPDSSSSSFSFLGRRQVVIAQSPVRIDLAGGWSDTPPICYEHGGAVLNVAVRVDGKKPIVCAARFIDRAAIVLKSLKQVLSTVDGSVAYAGDTVDCIDIADIMRPLSPDTPCALSLAALQVLGVVGASPVRKEQPSLGAELGGRVRLLCPGALGIELACMSSLPAGSGMGGSSILAATILKALVHLLDLPSSPELLVYQVSQVEQLLTTGGGWQDQVGAVYAGFKIARSPPGLPLRVSTETISLPAPFMQRFSERTCLIFTGQQRLARDTLINALRRFAITPPASGTLSRLVAGAEEGADALRTSSPDENEDDRIDSLARTLSQYWRLKCEMAPGSEPVHIGRLLQYLRPYCVGLSLCGAGAGGYAVAVLHRTVSFQQLQDVVFSYVKECGDEDELSVHRVDVDAEGISVSHVNDVDLDITTIFCNNLH